MQPSRLYIYAIPQIPFQAILVREFDSGKTGHMSKWSILIFSKMWLKSNYSNLVRMRYNYAYFCHVDKIHFYCVVEHEKMHQCSNQSLRRYNFISMDIT